MHSLRAQVLTLVVAAVLLTLTLFAYFGTRTAGVQFRAVISSTRQGPGESMHVTVDSTVVSRGLEGIRLWVEHDAASARPGDGAPRLLVVDSLGVVVASADSSLRGLRGQRLPGGRFRLTQGDSSQQRVVVIAGGVPLRGTGADTTAMVFRLPGPEQGIVLPPDMEGVARRFSTGVGRALWLGIPALLLAAALLALGVTGRLLDPIRRLTTAAQGIAAGQYRTRVGETGVTELRELATAFDRMAESLERSESARRQVMRDIAHELRTPLTNLKAQIEALQDGLRTPDAGALASLHEEATALERLVADVDVLARADAGRLDMHVEAFALAPLVRAVVDAFVHAGRLDRAAVRAQVDPGLVVRADRQRLGQVLRNLLDNAIRHGGAGVTVELTALRRGDRVVLCIADTGAGIPASHVPHVFDRLYRVDPSRARATGGAGLGLSIVKALVEAQHGDVSLASQEGRGTTVEVDLPAGSDVVPS